MRAKGWWWPIAADVSGSAGRFRIAKAVLSTAVWSLARGPSASGGRTAGEVCQATLERAGEEEELDLTSKGWWEVLQFADVCNGPVSAILHVCGGIIMGTDRGTSGNEPAGGMLDSKDARCLLSGHVRWGRGRAVDCAFVEGMGLSSHAGYL
jgi:hypothetical protein